MELLEVNLVVIVGGLAMAADLLKAANATGITILGATFVKIVGRAPTGQLVSTKQTCYVVKGLDYMLLSKEGCQKLGIIPSNFPCITASASGSVMGDSCTTRWRPSGCTITLYS